MNRIQYKIKKIKLNSNIKPEAYTYSLYWFSKHLPALVQVFPQASFINLELKCYNKPQ